MSAVIRFVLILLTLAFWALCLWVASAIGAPAPFARRAVRENPHPAALYGQWRMGWSSDGLQRGWKFHYELSPDGTCWGGYSASKPAWSGTWAVEGDRVRIRERLIRDGGAWMTFRIPRDGQFGQNSPGDDYDTYWSWLERPGESD